MTDTGKFAKNVLRGTPSDDDVRLLHALEHDPRFVLVYSYPQWNQAVFRRVPSM